MGTGPCVRCGADEWYLWTRASGLSERSCRPCMLARSAAKRSGIPRPHPVGHCFKCGDTLGVREKSWCRECHRENRLARWRAHKIDLVNEMGGKCSSCGWTPKAPHEYAAIDFHHRDPSLKAFPVSGNHMTRNRVRLRAEAAKCDLLCANCHRIHHAAEWKSRVVLKVSA